MLSTTFKRFIDHLVGKRAQGDGLSFEASKVLSDLRQGQNEAMGLPTGGGWVYLINDSNDFLDYQFGVRAWTADETTRVDELFHERQHYVDRFGVPYLMVITPEKSATYKEYLPVELAKLREAPSRPALYLAAQFGAMVTYPLDHLQAMKRHGLLYYRGDTHVNWLGGFHLYRHAIDAMRDRGFDLGSGIPLSHMYVELAAWQGDVLVQVPEALKAQFESDADLWRPMVMEESLVQYTLHSDRRRAHRLPEPDVFRIGRPERETIVTEQADRRLPRAVIFRDSTATLMVDLLAEHFSRAVFVWSADDFIGDLIEIEKPDVILHFKAERFISTYPTTPAISAGIEVSTSK